VPTSTKELGNSSNILSTLKGSVPGDVGIATLGVPELKVGTLDSLISLSDDLERVDRYVEGVVHRLEKELRSIITSDASDRETAAQRESREKQCRTMPFIEPGNMPANPKPYGPCPLSSQAICLNPKP
jgi:hypothetical protein